jgi:hypothetical protein
MAGDDAALLGPEGALPRPRYEPGDYLAASDLVTDQRYRRQRLRRHNRHLHGWGIVCGLWVAPARDSTRPWAVLVCPGYALGPYGDEIVVPCATLVDLHESLWSRPPDAARALIAIRHAERDGAPVPALPPGCGCAESIVHDSRTVERPRIDVLWRVPSGIRPTPFDLCHDLPPCPPCPESPYVLLASIALPADEGDPIVAIDHGVRAMI